MATITVAQQVPTVEAKSAPDIVGAPQQPPISVSDLRTRPVIGDLGVPLGTCVEIEATIVAGVTVGKGDSGDYFLNVTRIADKALQKPVLIRFYVLPWADVTVASNQRSLYELKYQQKAESLNTEQIEELERDYVGKAFRLLVWESGGYSGAPDNVPGGVTWQDHGFTFSTYLNVLSEPNRVPRSSPINP